MPPFHLPSAARSHRWHALLTVCTRTMAQRLRGAWYRVQISLAAPVAAQPSTRPPDPLEAVAWRQLRQSGTPQASTASHTGRLTDEVSTLRLAMQRGRHSTDVAAAGWLAWRPLIRHERLARHRRSARHNRCPAPLGHPRLSSTQPLVHNASLQLFRAARGALPAPRLGWRASSGPRQHRPDPSTAPAPAGQPGGSGNGGGAPGRGCRRRRPRRRRRS